ncbi:regulatory protein GemA [Desulfobulbus elongatus]|uniref:regulatory protein GemA n=1 Tax=Desulfobulbus elongatus TaxID=53332 RepID=UPI000482694E|nr:regulatory protein GemA [Desulfobulbus elongatus]
MPPSKAELAKIHIAKKQLGLNDEEYRDILKMRTGKDSAAKLTSRQAFALIRHFERLGFKPSRQPTLPGMSRDDSKQGKKILALWIELSRSGMVPDGSDRALNGFVKRQTGKDHLTWCSAEDKANLIEAMKKRLERRKDAAPVR